MLFIISVVLRFYFIIRKVNPYLILKHPKRDLFLTSYPTLIQKVDILPGLGDHDVVLAEGLIKPVFQKQKPRKVHLFAKADWEKLKSIMKDFQSKFLSSHAGKSVEELWTSFADALGPVCRSAYQ